MPVTRSDFYITTRELVWLSDDSVVYETQTLPTAYRLLASRTREQHEALQTWLTLYSNSRTAALGTEVFVLNVFSNLRIIRSTPEA